MGQMVISDDRERRVFHKAHKKYHTFCFHPLPASSSCPTRHVAAIFQNRLMQFCPRAASQQNKAFLWTSLEATVRGLFSIVVPFRHVCKMATTRIMNHTAKRAQAVQVCWHHAQTNQPTNQPNVEQKPLFCFQRNGLVKSSMKK